MLLLVGMAGPQIPVGVKRTAGAGIDIILALDISGSMRTTDMGLQSRFEVATSVIDDFIANAGQNRLGLVVFARQAFTQAPLTADHTLLSQLLDDVYVGMLPDGTAIGMAIATAANRLTSSDAKSKVIILLTDGANNAGEIEPVTAARIATSLGIKIYAIGVGRASLPDAFSSIAGRAPHADLDEETLKRIADEAGHYYLASDADTLRKIYADIDRMEKSEYKGPSETEYRQVYGRFVWPGLAILLAQFVLGATWLRKAP
jgi:Ca-activated chloride channel family protein